jgi:hypothetical protein
MCVPKAVVPVKAETCVSPKRSSLDLSLVRRETPGFETKNARKRKHVCPQSGRAVVTEENKRVCPRLGG